MSNKIKHPIMWALLLFLAISISAQAETEIVNLPPNQTVCGLLGSCAEVGHLRFDFLDNGDADAPKNQFSGAAAADRWRHMLPGRYRKVDLRNTTLLETSTPIISPKPAIASQPKTPALRASAPAQKANPTDLLAVFQDPNSIDSLVPTPLPKPEVKRTATKPVADDFNCSSILPASVCEQVKGLPKEDRLLGESCAIEKASGKGNQDLANCLEIAKSNKQPENSPKNPFDVEAFQKAQMAQDPEIRRQRLQKAKVGVAVMLLVFFCSCAWTCPWIAEWRTAKVSHYRSGPPVEAELAKLPEQKPPPVVEAFDEAVSQMYAFFTEVGIPRPVGLNGHRPVQRKLDPDLVVPAHSLQDELVHFIHFDENRPRVWVGEISQHRKDRNGYIVTVSNQNEWTKLAVFLSESIRGIQVLPDLETTAMLHRPTMFIRKVA